MDSEHELEFGFQYEFELGFELKCKFELGFEEFGFEFQGEFYFEFELKRKFEFDFEFESEVGCALGSQNLTFGPTKSSRNLLGRAP